MLHASLITWHSKYSNFEITNLKGNVTVSFLNFIWKLWERIDQGFQFLFSENQQRIFHQNLSFELENAQREIGHFEIEPSNLFAHRHRHNLAVQEINRFIRSTSTISIITDASVY